MTMPRHSIASQRPGSPFGLRPAHNSTSVGTAKPRPNSTTTDPTTKGNMPAPMLRGVPMSSAINA